MRSLLAVLGRGAVQIHPACPEALPGGRCHQDVWKEAALACPAYWYPYLDEVLPGLLHRG
jgi:hypothetical protein